MHVLVGSIKIDTGMFIKFVHNHKPEDAGKNFAQEGAVQFLPQPASSSFFYLFLSMAIGHMTGALAQKKSISVQSPTLKLLLYVCASKLRVASLMPNFLAIDYFGLFSPGNVRCVIALAHLHTRPNFTDSTKCMQFYSSLFLDVPSKMFWGYDIQIEFDYDNCGQNCWQI